MTARRRYRPRPRVYGRFGCIGCSLPLLAALAVLAAMVAAPYLMTVPAHITAALGDLGALLTHAGQSIVQGLVSGVESKFDAVKSFVSGIAHTLSSIA
jgi:hypothetical protein